MRRSLARNAFLFTFAALLGIGVDEVHAIDAARECERAATAMIAAMVRGDFMAATENFDGTMKQAFPASAVAAVWAATVAQYGEYKGSDKAQLTKGPAEAPHVASISMRFDAATIDGIVACSASGAIAGFHVALRSTTSIPPPVDAAFNADDARIQSAGIELGAMFYRPSASARSSFPLVVLVAGSGPMDKDGTIGANKPMRDIAIGLARAGIGVLAFDKRTFAYPHKPVATIDEEIVDDAVAAISHGASYAGVDKSRIFVLGHSLGGFAAPRIAERSATVAGIILLAPLVEPLDKAYLRQLRYLAGHDGKVDEGERALLDAADAAELRLNRFRKGHAPEGALPLGIPPSYWKSLWDYDPIAVARKVDRPVLALFAERDYQVLPEESAKRWQTGLDGGPPHQVRVYAGLGHTFMPMTAPPDPAMLLAAGHVDGVVIDDIASWIHRQRSK